MATPKDKNEEEILERIASLYGQLDDIRDQRKEVSNIDRQDGPRVVLVTRRLPRDERRRGQRVPDTMDQALSNFRQVTASGRDVYWVGSPVTHVQTAGEQRALRDQLLRDMKYAPVFLDAKRERLFYDGFCKRVLWPLFHSSPPTTEDTVMRAPRHTNEAEEDRDDDDTMWAAYVGANQAFSDAVRDVTVEGDLIWIQDYHFMLLPRMLRQLEPNAKLGFFLHVPFPSSELYRTLSFREEILKGLLAADLLGFQTYDYARHFLSSCEMVLGLETAPDHVEHEGHLTKVCVCPVGIEPEVVKARSLASPTLAAIRRLEGQLQGRALFLGVDTLDPTKGLVHKLLAFEDLFSQHPELADELVFVQVVLGAGGAANLKPEVHDGRLARTISGKSAKPTGRLELDVAPKGSKGVFSTLERQLHAMVSRINSQYATLDFEGPVQYFGADAKTPPGEATLAALFALADVLVITPIRDGMNVVPFEYLVAREAHKKLGAVLLSEFAGCARSLGGAVLVNPWDTRRVTTLLYRLFRRARRANMKEAQTRRRKVETVSSRSGSSGRAAFNSDDDRDDFDSDADEDESDVDSAEDSSADEADDLSDDGRSTIVASSDAGSMLKKSAQGGALRSRSLRARGVERKRAHEHMLQYVYNFTARSWARRFLDQLQEAAETKASRTLCRELTVPQLTAPYAKTKRRVLVLELEGVLAKPTALAELIDVPKAILGYLEALCADPRNRAVVILSARSAEILERVFEGIKSPTLVLAAEEGLSIRWRPGDVFEMQVSDFDLDLSWLEDAEPLIAYYTERTPGSVVERKVSGLAWHYRDCDLNHGAWQARQLQVALGELAKHVPLSVFSGDKFIEVRPMRLSVPNVLELTLKKFKDEDLASSLHSVDVKVEVVEESLPRRTSFDRVDDEIVIEGIGRHVDYVLFVASGNGLVDEEIFESMAPPPFDLDEFCARVARLNAGRDVDDDDDCKTPTKLKRDAPPFSPRKPLTPLRKEAPVLEQFQSVLAGGDRGTSDPARRADLVARREFNPRRDFPPSAMLFQAMRRRYGRDWSRVDLPTSASACWALVGGRTPRPGGARQERSTFLAELAADTSSDSPDVLPTFAAGVQMPTLVEGGPLVRTRSEDGPASPTKSPRSTSVPPEEKPSRAAMLTRALHANALALSRALRFPAPKADSLEKAARSVSSQQKAPQSPGRLDKSTASWTGAKLERAASPSKRSASPRLEDEAAQSSRVWESLQQNLAQSDPRAREPREVVPTSRLSKPGVAHAASRPAPVYVSVASRGAATAQQRREFDRAARIASARRTPTVARAVRTPPKLTPVDKAALAKADADADRALVAAAAAAAMTEPPSPSQGPEPAPELSDLALAAAAAAADSHPGLDLPLLTFSCIVGIKLSQATYYLRSQDLVATLLAQLADCAEES